jgi:hypothetical protein
VDQLITALLATVPVPGPTAIKLGR